MCQRKVGYSDIRIERRKLLRSMDGKFKLLGFSCASIPYTQYLVLVSMSIVGIGFFKLMLLRGIPDPRSLGSFSNTFVAEYVFVTILAEVCSQRSVIYDVLLCNLESHFVSCARVSVFAGNVNVQNISNNFTLLCDLDSIFL